MTTLPAQKVSSTIPGPPVYFVQLNPRSTKASCSVCSRHGFGPITLDREDLSTISYAGWQELCLGGHKPCPDCGQWMALKRNGDPHPHTRCPVAHPDRRTSKPPPSTQPGQGRAGA